MISSIEILRAMRARSPKPSIVAEKLSTAIRRAAKIAGIGAVKIVAEKVPGHASRRRFVVVSKSFERIPYADRQAFVWHVAEMALTKAEIEIVSQIVAIDDLSSFRRRRPRVVRTPGT